MNKSNASSSGAAQFKEGRPGWLWRENKLYMFSDREVEIVEGALHGGCGGLRSWRKDTQHPFWQGSWAVGLRVDIQIRSPRRRNDDGSLLDQRRVVGMKLRREAYLSWRSTIPMPLQRLVKPYRDRHIALLRLAVRTGGPAGPGAELLLSSPGLSMGIAHAYYLTQFHLRWDRIRSLLRRPQREIIAQIGLASGTEAQARLLRKIEPASLSYSVLVDLSRAIAQPDPMKFLAHCERVNAGVLALVLNANIRDHVSINLLNEVGSARNEMTFGRTAKLLNDVLRMCKILGRGCGRFDTRAQMRNRHDELVDRLGGEGAITLLEENPDLAQRQWPSAPLPGIVDDAEGFRVRPIDGGWRDLLEHGRVMRHCAGSYAPRVIESEGAAYFYAVELGSDRATVLIQRESNGSYHRLECSGPGNGRVAPDLLRRIDAWLRGAQSADEADCEISAQPEHEPDGDVLPF